MPVIEIDPQAFLLQHRGGISRYFSELVRHLPPCLPEGWSIRTPYRRVRSAHALDALPDRFSALPKGILGRTTLRLWGHAVVRGFRPRPSVLHSTYYQLPFVPATLRTPTVSTIHDMIPEIFPELFPRGNPHAAKRLFARQSKIIIAVSRTTCRDLQAYFDIPESRIRVIPLGVDERFFVAPTHSREKNSYMLFIGSRGGYKNFGVLLRALALLPKRTVPRLVAVGGNDFSERERSRIQELGLSDRVQHLRSSDDNLPGLYAGADLLVVPSLYEGFGLPTLEAMASGCPVLLSEAGSLPEIAGDSAMYFPPRNEQVLAQILETIFADEAIRERLSVAGRDRAKQFTWQGTATATVGVYKELI